jgi:hypothetical protein
MMMMVLQVPETTNKEEWAIPAHDLILGKNQDSIHNTRKTLLLQGILAPFSQDLGKLFCLEIFIILISCNLQCKMETLRSSHPLFCFALTAMPLRTCLRHPDCRFYSLW